MTVFFTLVSKIAPLYLLVLAGYIVGKKITIDNKSIVSLLLYVVSPVLIFHGTFTANLQPNTLSLFGLFFILASSMNLLFYWIGKYFFRDATRNILAYTAGTGNSGYFGIPVAMTLFGERSISLLAMCILGFMLYDVTIGFLITARGRHTLRESMEKALKLPLLYAFAAGILANVFRIPVTDSYMSLIGYFIGTSSVLGMMLIGLAIASQKTLEWDGTFLLLTVIARFIAWPVIVFGIIRIDVLYFGFFTPLQHSIMTLVSVVPLAVNTIVYATALNAHPQKAALAVLISTTIALFSVPLMLMILAGVV